MTAYTRQLSHATELSLELAHSKIGYLATVLAVVLDAVLAAVLDVVCVAVLAAVSNTVLDAVLETVLDV